jgi:hypothetical protein
MGRWTLQMVKDEEGRELGVMLFVPKGQWEVLRSLLEEMEDFADALAALEEERIPYQEIRLALEAEGKL